MANSCAPADVDWDGELRYVRLVAAEGGKVPEMQYSEAKFRRFVEDQRAAAIKDGRADVADAMAQTLRVMAVT